MRQAVTQYCSVGGGNEMSGKLNLHYPLHPMLKRSFVFLKPYFEQIAIKD